MHFDTIITFKYATEALQKVITILLLTTPACRQCEWLFHEQIIIQVYILMEAICGSGA